MCPYKSYRNAFSIRSVINTSASQLIRSSYSKHWIARRRTYWLVYVACADLFVIENILVSIQLVGIWFARLRDWDHRICASRERQPIGCRWRKTLTATSPPHKCKYRWMTGGDCTKWLRKHKIKVFVNEWINGLPFRWIDGISFFFTQLNGFEADYCVAVQSKSLEYTTSNRNFERIE